jgi:hypothetical protein
MAAGSAEGFGMFEKLHGFSHSAIISSLANTEKKAI